MFRIGQPEIDAVAKVINSGKLFRYRKKGPMRECERFEHRFGRFLRVKQVCMASSGTAALTAALVGLGIGPGDEVLVPAHTYMATAVAVLAVGAIPVIVDIDESLTIDPKAMENAIGPHTRAVIPVHMWGVVCDMDTIMRIARKRKLLVIEDACQCAGGGYEGRKVGSIGHAGAFSFNHFKNMTCGEGGAVVSNDAKLMQSARCSIDCCRAYWNPKEPDFVPFTSNGSRASEIEGAIMNAQLNRLPSMIRATRDQKKRMLRTIANTRLKPIPAHSLDYECGTAAGFTFPTSENADAFAAAVGGVVALKTGRHTFIEWGPVLNKQGAAHPDFNPYNFPSNARCRKDYPKNLCATSLQILARTVMVGTHPDRPMSEQNSLISKMKEASDWILGPVKPGKQMTRRRALTANAV